MKWWQNKRRVGLVIGALVALPAAVAAVLAAVRADRTAASSPSTTSAQASTTAADTTSFVVHFHQGAPGDPRKVVAVLRSVPKTAAVATAALTELLRGPTEAERRAGYWSMSVGETAGDLKSVRVGGVAHVDFLDFREIIPNANSSFGGAALLAELDSTLQQFATVEPTVYLFNGDVAAFYRWLQLTPPSRGRSPGRDRGGEAGPDRGRRRAGCVRRNGPPTRYLSRKMEELDIPPIPEFVEMIADTGAGLYACQASVDLFGLSKEDFIDQVQDIITVGEFYELAAGGQIIFT